MDGAINTAAFAHALVCRIHDRIYLKPGDIAPEDFDTAHRGHYIAFVTVRQSPAE